MNQILREDIEDFVVSFPLGEEFKDSFFHITGGTGLIGSTIIHCLLA